jgi:putative ABC transport system permease protein
MVPLARKTLFQDIPRFLVAQAGVAFAVGLIAIQSGIYLGFVKGSGMPVDQAHADIWVAAKEMQYFELALPISFDNVGKARKVQGVESVEALLLKTSAWRGPGHKAEYIRVIGFDPRADLWSPGPVPHETLAKLRFADTAIVDSGNLKSLNISGVGGYGKIGQHNVRVIGLTHGTQPLISATFIFTSLRNAKAFLAPPTPKPGTLLAAYASLRAPPPPVATPSPKATNDPATLDPSDDISYILVKAQSGTDLDVLKKRLDDALPDTTAYTQPEMAEKTRSYWLQRTRIGFILGLAAVVGLIVGMTVVGQILYTSVAEHIKEYGTLRAIGAPDALFYGIVAEQAMLMALLGYVPGIALALAVSLWSASHRNVSILITPTSAALVLVVIVVMCVLSGAFAVQRALRVDPAIVFKA